MAARVCHTCDEAYPLDIEVCPACGDDCPQVMTAFAKPDWKTRAEKRKTELETAAGQYVPDWRATQVIANRSRRIHDAGLPYSIAIELAGRRGENGGFQVDIAEFERLAKKAGPEMAARILG